MAVACSVLTALGVAALVVAVLEARDSRERARVATSRFLAATAVAKADASPDLAMLLALEGYRLVEGLQPERSLEVRRALLETSRRNVRLRAILRGHKGEVSDVAVAPDGHTVATGGADGTIRLWDAASRAAMGEPLRGHKGEVTDLAFDDDGETLASAGADGTVRLWHPVTGAPRGVLRGHEDVWSVAFSPDGRTLASGGSDGVRLWDVERGVQIGTRLSRQTNSVSFHPDGQRLVTVVGYGGVAVLDVSRGAVRSHVAPMWCANPRCYPPAGDDLVGGELSPDGRTLALVGAHGFLGLSDLSAPLRARLLSGIAGDEIGFLAFSPDSRTVAATESPFQAVRFWDVARRTPKGARVRLRNGRVNALAYFPDGRTVAIAGRDGTVRLWDISPAEPSGDRALVTVPADNPGVKLLTPDGTTVVSASEDGVVRLRDGVGTLRRTLPGRADYVEISEDGQRLVTADWNSGTVAVWDVATATHLAPGLRGELYRLGSSADGNRILLINCCPDRESLTLWERGHRPRRARNALPLGRDAYSAEFSPDGRTVAVTSYNAIDSSRSRITLWDAERLAPLGTPLPGGVAYELEFSPDGRTLAYVDDAGSVRLWDVEERRPIGEPIPGGGGAELAFSPDGRILGTSWDMAQTIPLGEGRGALTTGVRIGADGWLIPDLAGWRERICGIVGRSLTEAEWQRFLPDERYGRTCP